MREADMKDLGTWKNRATYAVVSWIEANDAAGTEVQHIIESGETLGIEAVSRDVEKYVRDFVFSDLSNSPLICDLVVASLAHIDWTQIVIRMQDEW
jgi:hypothetical protein